MDIGQISLANSQANTMTSVGIAVLSMSMDTIETLGDEMVKMMEQSVNPHIGGNIDVSV
ncbi:MAG: YjfB family protein [Lachnospiraceae bacterium]|nr:YjfB family protein [Lachnospiraceae bacterium]